MPRYFIKESIVKSSAPVITICFKPNFLENYWVLKPITNTPINLTYSEVLITPSKGGRVALSKAKYNLLFDKEKRRISAALRNLHKFENQRYGYIVYTVNFDKPQSASFTKLLKSEFENVESIQQVVFDESVSEAGEILSKLLEKYIGKNVVIPYDTNQREKLYPLAFNELKDYMKKYQKNSK